MSWSRGAAAGVSGRRLSVWVLVATTAWTVESAVYAVQVQVQAAQSGRSSDFGAELTQSFVSALLWVPFTVLALWLAFRWPVTADRRYWLVHLGGFLALVVVRAAAVVVLNEPLGYFPGGVPAWDALLLSSVLNNLVTYVLLTGLAHAVFYREAVRTTKARFAAARLGALTSQLQPHFLFNALNTIVALIPTRPETAERMVVDLASLLRFSLERDSSALITLEEEVEIGRAYLKIEEHRFADRLRVRIRIDPDVAGTAVPPFILQPLLENAVRHGLAGRDGRSTLEIRAARLGDDVHITVSDDGVGLPDDPASSDARQTAGVGLTNVRDRLAGTFGAGAHLELANREPGGAEAVVVVPFRPLVALERTR